MELHDAIVVLTEEIKTYDEDRTKAIAAKVDPPNNPVAEATRTLLETVSAIALPPIGSKSAAAARKFLETSALAINMPGRMAHREMLYQMLKEFEKWLSAMPTMMRHAANLEIAACAQIAKNLGAEDVFKEIEARLPPGVRLEVSEPISTGETGADDGGPERLVSDSPAESVVGTIHGSDESSEDSTPL